MTTHHSPLLNEHYDSDFDDAKPETPSLREEVPSSATIQIQLTPTMIFFVGFSMGMIVMAIPLIYFVVKAAY